MANTETSERVPLNEALDGLVESLEDLDGLQLFRIGLKLGAEQSSRTVRATAGEATARQQTAVWVAFDQVMAAVAASRQERREVRG